MWPLFKFINLLYLLLSSNIWFSYMLPGNYIGLMCSLIMVVCIVASGRSLRFDSRAFVIFCLLTAYSIYNIYIINIGYGIMTFMSYVPALMLFMLDKDSQKDLLKYVTKWFCIFMGVSVIWFLLSNVISLPNTAFYVPFNTFYGRFDNYFFFLSNVKTYGTDVVGGMSLIRFGGPFLEPGHLANICCLLLFANRYRMKERPLLWILVVAVLLSFSLAGYVLLALSLLLLKVRNVISTVSILGLFLGSWAFFSTYNNGDNPVNLLIFSRMEYDSNKGIVGNNRTTKRTDYFFRQCIREDRAWFGLRSLDAYGDKIEGAGYKIFVLRNGFIGLAFVALLYLLMIPAGTNRRYALSFLFIVTLIFVQRSYPYWYAWLFSFVIGNGIMRAEKFNAPLDEEPAGLEDIEEAETEEETEAQDKMALQ